MRETKFYNYQSTASLELAQVYQVDNQWHNTRPSYDAPIRGVPIRAGGLAGPIIAWRVEAGREILLENVLNHTVLRIVLPSLLSCIPVIRTRDSPEQLAVLASFQTQSGCEFVRIHCDFPSAEQSNELVRVESLQGAVDEDIVSALHSSPDGTYFFGLVTSQCGRVIENYGPQPCLQLERFDMRADDDDVSASSDASTASRGYFITRLLNTPRNLLPTPARNTGARTSMGFETPGPRSARGSLMSLASPLSTRRHAATEPPQGDSVEALCAVTQNETYLVALHASGRICAYSVHNGLLAGEGTLGLTLAKDFPQQFLLKASQEHIVAVVTVDEDPQANSVRVFSITLKRHIARTVDVMCNQLAKRGGPIDRVVGAALLGNDVLVGTESGAISGPMNGPDAQINGTGLPLCKLWTAIDDIEQTTGFGHAVNAMVENARERLLAAHRFSSGVIAKAMRLTDLPNTSREVVEKYIRDSRFTEEEIPLFLKAVARAEFLAIDTDMPLRGIQMVDGVGLVASRNSGLFVFRKLMQEEHVALSRSILTFTEKDILSGPVACLAASHAISQVLCSKLSRTMKTDHAYENLLFMMQLSLRFSEVAKHLPLTYCIAQQRAIRIHASQVLVDDSAKAFPTAVDYVQSILAPGGKSIRFLYDANEMLALQLCATHSASFVPVSSFFASGLAWLSQYTANKNSVSFMNGGQMTNGNLRFRENFSDIGENGTSQPDFNGFLQQSYGCLVSAAQVASSSEGLAEEDRDCVLHLAKILKTVHSENSNGDMQIDTQVDAALGGVRKEEFVEHLGYWLLERSVRLFESAGSPKTAAAAALEAMKTAPSRDYYETMRAAAFGRLLDARELQTALNTQLKPPFDAHNETVVSRSEASALRDGIGLFVNAVADEGQLKWLAEVELPEPLNSLAALTLERRARAAEPLDADAELESMKLSDSEEELKTRKIYEYEYLYAWHLGNYNAAAAAASALEWGERLSNEGLSIAVSTSFSNNRMAENEARLRLLLAWAGMKVRAFSCALAVVQTMEPNKQYFARTKFSILAQDPQDRLPGVITPDWVSRRQLLAHAQRLCITRMLSDSNTQRVISQLNFLTAHGSQYLQGTEQGINWIINVLCDVPSPENIQLGAELAAAWIKENGEQQLALVVTSAAKLAANPAVSMFDYSHFNDLLVDVYNMAEIAGVNRNWSLLGLKSALTQLTVELQIPQWLVDQAAWGLSESNLDVTKISGTKSRKGDVGSVARAFLEVSRPIDAAKVLLSEFRRFAILKGKKCEDMLYYYNRQVIPFAAIDATIIMLGRMEEDDHLTDVYLVQLKDETQKYCRLAVNEYKDVVVKYKANQDNTVMV